MTNRITQDVGFAVRIIEPGIPAMLPGSEARQMISELIERLKSFNWMANPAQSADDIRFAALIITKLAEKYPEQINGMAMRLFLVRMAGYAKTFQGMVN